MAKAGSIGLGRGLPELGGYADELLDSNDRKILWELDRDCRQSYAEIGKKLGLSKQVVKYRVERLLEGGVLKGFTAIVDFAKLGMGKYYTYWQLQNLTKQKEADIIRFLAESPEIGWLARCSGSFEIITSGYFGDAIASENFLRKLSEKYGEFIQRRSITRATKQIYFGRKYFNPAERVAETVLGGMKEASPVIDELNKRILDALVRNARMPLVNIASEVGSSPNVVAGRMRGMEKARILMRYNALVDVAKIGYSYYHVILNLGGYSPKREAELEEFCRTNPNVLLFTREVGAGDLSLGVEVPSHEEFYNVMSEVRSRFCDIIRGYEPLLQGKEYKEFYFSQRAKAPSKR
jgi:DNA-binding Lrp family transcriptional regulator